MLRSSSVPALPSPGISLRASASPPRLLSIVLLALCVAGAAGCGRNQPLSPELGSSATPMRTAGVAYVDPTPGVPLHLIGMLGPGAQYVIDKPASWNGMLIVWAHGYIAPDDPIQVPNLGALGQFFLSQGFALAASSFSENGYAVAEGSRQTHQLAMLFSDLVAEPDRRFLVGVSLGSIISLKILETLSHTYDGALLVSTLGGGSDDEVRYLADVWVLFDKFFPDASLPPLFGERPGPFPQAQLVGLITDPDNAQRFQLFLAFARERSLPFASGPEAVQATLTALGFAWIGALDFLDRTHGHVLVDNSETVYTAPGVPQPIVDDVNATVDRFTSTLDAEAYLRKYYEPDGDPQIPVITLHDERDPLVPIFHEDLYRILVQLHDPGLLRQYSVDAFGHVSPTLQGQIPSRFLELVTWVNLLAATP